MGKQVVSQRAVNRYDIVGSFLRPKVLKEARKKYGREEISLQELRKVEDQEITKLINKEKEVGLVYITDGEFRRSYWHLDFFWGFNGVEHNVMDQGYLFHGEETRADSARLSGKVTFNRKHPVFDEFAFTNTFAEDEVQTRQSIPAPAQFFAELVRGKNQEKVFQYYTDYEELYQDIAQAYRQTILELYRLGCRNVKLDDCTWGMLVDKGYWQSMTNEDYDLQEIQDLYLQLNNAALKDLPADLHITTHVCRGNYHSTFASSGGYEPVAQTLFDKENVEAFFLEFDDDRSGDFAPLRFVPEGKQVVLGLVTSKSGKLEDKQVIIDRIYEANQYVPLEYLNLSPQCGFASTEEGNILTEQQQWEKLRLIIAITQEVWG
ncbi:5-methyltetrahydropteroyltriglutamate--homocysteine methyltransferase [Tetragenococcus osmophilus]|uniref:5-methyltetrahydropteroyltriglutamate--homocysteine methyltransferase n=1 Tax=Tetragenococcus osmophilus TaxID=526944 RepID=A0AA37XLJ6_9ENTE|nr:5-methyltetrahydropteroyltriglutamate--homocysteine S-methyltransferase [Tetragenococcus osmophilus]AYW47933.1 5-methyltetrahydropteroyltriglutamate--homocysteine methyltransferase [Tetragenococcus osmophilus]GMA53643.1 5-methyltetrahydropteroyltriglutamate--homocysteine methyltransferase [Alicyclobacillus contaminans]GMA72420.1 5-methyltetrahydropteroyltriglutamate--homocysteine methyltransferase [Tetragenococcus osmophilus]